LIVRDDGSTDETVKIVQRFCETDPRVQLLVDSAGNLGASRSFLKLLEASDAELFMLADQDDNWLLGKISSSVQKIEELVASNNGGRPLLVFTDLTVCDEALNKISDSLWKHQKLDPEICNDWRRLLAQNVVTGCTIIGNAAARRASLPFVLDEMFHDHWIAVNAARSGVIDYLPMPTVMYRQHLDNAEGAKDFGYRYALERTANPLNRYWFYRKAGRHFGISANRILYYKIVESIKRFVRK
jgi:glycosyltransferase involved in cell wall biosynthesis